MKVLVFGTTALSSLIFQNICENNNDKHLRSTPLPARHLPAMGTDPGSLADLNMSICIRMHELIALLSHQFKLINCNTVILPERIFVDVTILAISPRISMLLGSLFKPFFHLTVPVCPIPFRTFFLSPPFPVPLLTKLKYLAVLDFLNRFVLV